MAADTLGGPNDPLPGERRGLTGTQWLICIIAALGFAFDIYELLMLPLIVRPALLQLVNAQPGTDEFQFWVGMLFFIPAFAGGIFGLLGGYLTDRLGRRRVLTWSILLYAFSAFAAGFATNIYMLLFLRCLVFIGVCIEFVAAVAWLAELFPDPKTRERVLGYTQAFSSVGGLLVAYANGIAVDLAANKSLPAIYGSHDAWRYTLMSGVIPALPLILIRPFLPESPVWSQKRAAGTLKRPSIGQLFSPQFFRTTVVTTIIFACSYGAAFGAIQHMPQIAPGLVDVRERVRAGTADLEKQVADTVTRGAPPEQVAKVRAERGRATRLIEQKSASDYTKIQEYGGLTGRFLLAFLAVRIVSRQRLLRLFQVPGLIIMPLVFGYAAVNNRVLFNIGDWPVTLFTLGIFLAGLVTVAQFSFWGNYLPRVYPVHLRGTGESFAANIGGRMLGTSFAFVTSTLAASALFPKDMPAPQRVAYTAAGVALFVYAVGLIFSFFLPEPGHEDAE